MAKRFNVSLTDRILPKLAELGNPSLSELLQNAIMEEWHRLKTWEQASNLAIKGYLWAMQ